MRSDVLAKSFAVGLLAARDDFVVENNLHRFVGKAELNTKVVNELFLQADR